MLKLSGLIFTFLIIVPVLAVAEELVFVTLDNAPQTYVENGKTTGFLAEIVTEAAKRAGYTSKVLIVP